MYWKSWPVGTGGWPICPAATCTFCSRRTLDHVAGRQVPRRQLVRVEPDAHAVVLLAEDEHVADAVHAGQRVLELDGGVIAQVELVVVRPAGLRVVVGIQVDHQQDVRATASWWSRRWP